MACTILGRTVCKSMVTFLLEWSQNWVRRCSFHDLAKARVMILGVIATLGIAGGLAATHDPPGAPVASPGRLDGVFVVEAASLPRQLPLAIAEHHAVFRVGEGSPGKNQLMGLLGF